ncbi:MAG: ABC transporter [Flammeovirgaceae bacterium]|nr:ABC transporter [Flammeovirgaceae bacterium]
MKIVTKLILESFRFAWSALKMNMLRTTLSLLGVTIGIFAIISVFTLVDSLERSLKESFNFLGSNTIILSKWPWGLGGDEPYPWWKYLKRPYPTWEEYEFLEENVNNALSLCISANKDNIVSKFRNNSSNEGILTGVSHTYKEVYELNIEEGRYFTKQESIGGRPVAIIGHRIAKDLFADLNPIGQTFKIKGISYYVIGKLKEEGEGFLEMESKDDQILIPYHSFTKLYYVGKGGLEAGITLKGYESDLGLIELESEVKGLMRSKRGLKPREEENFAINHPEAIAEFIGATFDVIGIAGWVIGSFSILVGGFGIANIMFVSVRERTNIIGIQKSLGAKNYFILFQFLFESVFLSLIGGGFGILLVYLLSFANLGTLDLKLSFYNVFLGLGVSVIIGVVSGIVPAVLAARMDPVIAIRTN